MPAMEMHADRYHSSQSGVVEVMKSEDWVSDRSRNPGNIPPKFHLRHPEHATSLNIRIMKPVRGCFLCSSRKCLSLHYLTPSLLLILALGLCIYTRNTKHTFHQHPPREVKGPGNMGGL